MFELAHSVFSLPCGVSLQAQEARVEHERKRLIEKGLSVAESSTAIAALVSRPHIPRHWPWGASKMPFRTDLVSNLATFLSPCRSVGLRHTRIRCGPPGEAEILWESSPGF